jgi:hypothetical protein
MCVYDRSYQFENFLISLTRQTVPPDEVIIVDNGTPDKSVLNLCEKYLPELSCGGSLMTIDPEHKDSYNSAKGLNIATDRASGEYIALLADSNVLLSDNLTEDIRALIGPWSLVTSYTREYRTSPEGTYQSEYSCDDKDEADRQCKTILDSIGWPCDIGEVDLDNKYIRDPAKQLGIDSYLIALKRDFFIDSGGYSEQRRYWGRWSVDKNLQLAQRLKVVPLQSSRIIHQFHHMTKDNKPRFTPK